MSYKKLIAKMEKEFKLKFPELNVAFHITKKNVCVHLGLDQSIFSYENYTQIIAQINTFFSENFGTILAVSYSKLIHTTKWKWYYIISRKRYE